MDPLTAMKQTHLEGSSDAFSSTIQLQIDTKSAHLGASKNITSTTPRATSRDFADLGIRGTITHLEHGSYGGKPSSLITIRCHFLFDSTSERNRFARAEIRTVCNTLGHENTSKVQKEKASSTLPPRVVRFCPVLLQGQSTRKSISNTVEARIEASLAPAIASLAGAGVSGGYSVTEKFDKDFEMMVKGIPWSVSDDGGDNEVDNAVIWKITENTAIGKGIPDELNFALLIQHDGSPFQATLEIKVWTKGGLRLFGWPWPKPNPLIFRPSAFVGTPLGLATFDELEDGHWKALAPHEGPLQVCFLGL